MARPFSRRAYCPAVLFLLLVLATAGGAQQRLPAVTAVTPRLETYPSLSPSGKYLVYSSNVDGVLRLYRRDLTTGEVLGLTHGDFEDSAASWSPDGTTIVFQREDKSGNRDIWVIDADGSNARNLTSTPRVQEQHPRYAPDGSAILFDSNRPDSMRAGVPEAAQNYDIYTKSLRTGAVTRLTAWDGWDMYPSLNPAMTHMVWRRALPGRTPQERNFEIFMKDLRTGQETNLTNHEGYDSNPHWSPAGEWIVFVSNRAGSSDLYVIRPDGSGLQRLAAGAAGTLGYARPSFSQDGLRIVANRVVAGVTDMVMIDFDPAAARDSDDSTP